MYMRIQPFQVPTVRVLSSLLKSKDVKTPRDINE